MKTGEVVEVRYNDYCNCHIHIDGDKFGSELHASVYTDDLSISIKKFSHDPFAHVKIGGIFEGEFSVDMELNQEGVTTVTPITADNK